MQTLRLIIVASGMALLLPGASFAESADDLDQMTPEQRREYVQGLSGEERQALREERRARWEAMSNEERAALRAKRRETLENMSDEEKAAMRGMMREKKGRHGRHHRKNRRDCDNKPQD